MREIIVIYLKNQKKKFWIKYVHVNVFTNYLTYPLNLSCTNHFCIFNLQSFNIAIIRHNYIFNHS